MKTQPVTIKRECPDCHATGLYVGAFEPKGIGVICNTCKGTGESSLTYTPFTERKTRDNVEKVYVSSIPSEHGNKPVTYKEFLDGKMPE